MGVSNAASHSEVILNRIFFFLVCLTETFWVGNYQNVWSKLPLSNSKNISTVFTNSTLFREYEDKL